MQPIDLPSFRVFGIQTRTSNADEQTLQTARLPLLWHDVYTELVPELPATAPVYGVYAGYESDQNGEYTVTAGAGENPENCTLDLVEVTVPPGRYLVFTGKGKMPETVIRVWLDIWDYFKRDDVPFERAYTSDFEEYWGREETAMEVKVHIAVK